MKVDITRVTSHPFKHFTRVLMQQGRVQVDADWNEQASILIRNLRLFLADVIGPHGGPNGNHLGFAISPLPQMAPPVFDFAISAGHYYVDGILCANDPTPVAITAVQQPITSPMQVTVEVWTVDGVSFQNGQYVEVFDAAKLETKPAIAVVSSATEATRLLSLTLDVGSVSQWITRGDAMPRVRRLLTYATQPDYPMSKSDLRDTTYQVYLDVWERLITYVEDETIREAALGGADTAARARLICQVKTDKPQLDQQCAAVGTLTGSFQPRNRGLLKARTTPTIASTDPCIISPDSKYRGPENQLYRVEIHAGGTLAPGSTAAPTFKWSRENGSVVFPIVSGGGTNVVTLETLGRDDRFGLAEGDYVEVQDDDGVLHNDAGTLLRVQAIDRTTMKVTLSGTRNSNVGNDPRKHPLLRRWDQEQGDETEGGLQLWNDNAALIKEGTGETNWLNLEDGVQIQFQAHDNAVYATYRTGDYWIIPARTATGNVEWPTEIGTDSQNNPTLVPVALPPLGVTHHYAPLAVVTMNSDGTFGTLTRCQPTFGPLAQLV